MQSSWRRRDRVIEAPSRRSTTATPTVSSTSARRCCATPKTRSTPWWTRSCSRRSSCTGCGDRRSWGRGCPQMKQLIAGEDEAHPDKWLRHVAAHVDVCRTCSLWREDQPNAIRLISEVPAEPAPPEVRDEVLDRVDLLWSVLGPPEWTAAVLGQSPPDVPTATTGGTTEATAHPTPPPTAVPDDVGEPSEPGATQAPRMTTPPAIG